MKRVLQYNIIAIMLVLTTYIGVSAGAFSEDSLSVKKSVLAEKLKAKTVDEYKEPKTLRTPLGLKRKFKGLSKVETKVSKWETNDRLPKFQPTPTPDDEYHIQHARELYQQVVDEQRFAKVLDAAALVDLPIGIVGTNSQTQETDYAILIDSLNITPQHAYLVVYMSIPIPQSDQRLTFMGTNIAFTKNGGLTGDVKLQLLSDVGFNLPGDNVQVTIKGGEKTYAEWDCNGFKSMSIDAEVLFSRNWLVPAGEEISNEDEVDNLENEGKNRVKGYFNISGVTHWSDLVATISIDPFRIRGMSDFDIEATNAVFDFSDYHNASGIVFPEGYESPQFIDGDKSAWRGFYLQQMKVTLPDKFQKRGEDKRIEFIARDLLIDNMGISGELAVTNLIPLNEGDIEGWAFSLDSLGIGLNASTITSAGFNGGIVVPINDESKPLNYTAIINPGQEYLFNVQTADTLDFELWKAKVKLHPNSEFEIRSVTNGKWIPKATLHGSMDIADEAREVKLVDIDFEGLVITTDRPYLDVQSFSFSSDYLNNYQSFPLGLEEIGLKKLNERKAALEIKMRLKLSDAGFTGDAKLQVLASMQTEDGRDRWRYEKTRLSEVGVEIDGGSYYIKGWLAIFEEDPKYGKGFHGNVEMRFEPGFEVTGTALFGKVDGFRYWYSDGFVSLPTGIPFYPPLAFYGFGGGMYSNMAQVGMSNTSGQHIGKTVSGLVYEPDQSIKYGLKATVQIGLVGSKETFNADATFEIAFRDTGGVSRISLTGNGYIMADQYFNETTMGEQLTALGEEAAGEDAGPQEGRGMIRGHLYTYFDFDNDVLHGELEVYVNVLGGALQGTGPQGRAGKAVTHFGPDTWHILIGTPENRMGLSLLDMFKTESYIMTGENIPGSPPPPPMMREIMDDMDLDYMRDLNALESGIGFAFGSSMEFDTGDITFLVFYARLSAGAGFDIMMKDYGDARCVGSTDAIGINGWYANGQAYAYVRGEVGIKFKIFGSRKKKRIFSGSAAMLMQTRLPNPFWMKGAFTIKYRILGGLIKGSVDFEVEVGDKCEVVGGSVLQGITVIGDLKPLEGARDVDVFMAPQAVFNIPVEKEFEMLDIDDIKKTFRIKLDHFNVLNEGTKIPATLEWNDDHSVVAYRSKDILPPNTQLQIEIQLSFEEKIGNGSWRPVKTNMGKLITESRTGKFTTGEAPDYIPAHNVAYSYPVMNQFNFYKGEHNRGYIKLRVGQPYLFELEDGWRQEGRFVPESGQGFTFDFNYSNRQINFTVPSGTLDNDRVYSLQLVSTPSAGGVDSNVKTITKDAHDNVATVNTEITTKQAEGYIVSSNEEIIFRTYFRTSKYSTFNQKFNSLDLTSGWSIPDVRTPGPVHELGSTIYAEEYFDKAEINGLHGLPSLVQLKADIKGHSWYTGKIYPLVYDDYPFVPGMSIRDRSLDLGLPPEYATYLVQNDESAMVTESNASGNPANPARAGKFSFQLDYYMYKDYKDLQAQAARYFVEYPELLTERMRYILETIYPVISQGDYKVDVKYVLPGKEQPNTTKSVYITNPFNYED